MDEYKKESDENITDKEIQPDETIAYDYAKPDMDQECEPDPEYKENKFAYEDNTEPEKQEHVTETKTMDLKDWVLTLVILMIPCVGIVMYFVWAFGNDENITRRNFCRAQLIIFGVLLAIYAVFFAMFGTVIMRSVMYY